MNILARLKSWKKTILRRSDMETDMDDELRFHLEAHAQDLIRGGMKRDAAMRSARMALGGIETQKEDCRASLGLRFLDELSADLRYGWRMLRQSPGFTAVAIVSLALGVGANTAIFSMMEELLLKTLPVSHPEQLRLLSWAGPDPLFIYDVWGNYSPTPSGGHSSNSFSYPVFLRLRSQNTVFQDLFAFKDSRRLTATIDGKAEAADGQMVSGNFYRDLGMEPIAGRAILPSDDLPASTPVAIISYAYWKQRFGSSISAVGKTVELNGTPVTIVGVNPPEFRGTKTSDSPEFFFPLAFQPRVMPNPVGSLLESNEEFWVLIMGRLKPGVTESQAQAALNIAFAQDLKETLPSHKGKIPRLELLTGSRGFDTLRQSFSKPVSLLLAMSGLVLLLACVNLANLLLARASFREREIGVRVALGAGRGRIIRQVFTESLLLALLGGAAGMLLGYWGRNLIPSLTHNPWEKSFLEGQFDLRVLGFAIAISVLTGILFGMAPAWRSTRNDVNSSLKETARNIAGRTKALAGKMLVSFQVTLSVLLVIGSGLFVRTLINLHSTNIGFEPNHVLLFSLEPPRTRYPAAKRVPFFRKVEEKLATIPGVSDVGASGDALIAGDQSTTGFAPEGIPKHTEQPAWVNYVSTRFFQTMGIPIIYGRGFDARDTAKSPRVAVINELLAKRFFPNLNPISRTFKESSNDQPIQIVGVCSNTKVFDVRSDEPAVYYVPYVQENDMDRLTYEIKTAANPSSVAAAIRHVVRSIDPNVPVLDIRTQTEQIDAMLMQERLFAVLTSSFGFLALLLASIGVYGILAYTVARRTNEIGIRMALGAQSPQVLRSVLCEAAWLACIGIAGGVVAAFGFTRLVTNMLYGLKPGDPATLLFAVLLLFMVTLLAGWIPARRASRVDPLSALRHE